MSRYPYDDADDEYDDDSYDKDDSGDDDFDYDSFVEENFGDSVTNTQTKPLWRLVTVVLLSLIAVAAVLQFLAIF